MFKYDILKVDDKLIAGERLVEVVSSKIFERPGEPDPEGLASYEIFGFPGTEERKKRFAYIDLSVKFVHPHCLFELKSLKRQYMDLINGDGEFYIKDGDICKVEGVAPSDAKVGSGVDFLYENWEKLKFDTGDVKSGIRFNRSRFIKSLEKEQIFMSKLLVMPAFYRDVDMRDGGNRNEFNNLYIKIINLVSIMKSTSSMFTTLDNDVSDAYKDINNALIEFHEMVIKTQGGRKGFIHKYVMGKSIDFAARLVISGLDTSKVASPKDMTVTFERTTLPLFACIKCFAPFIVHGVRDIIMNFLQGSEYMMALKDPKKGIVAENIIRHRLSSDWQTVLTSNYIYNLIELFHEAPEHRLDYFQLPCEDGVNRTIVYYHDDISEVQDEYNDVISGGYEGRYKNLTLLELFYIAAYNTVKDKHIYITRYPIEDHNNTYPSKMSIIPYNRTVKARVGDSVYPFFPVIDREKDMENISAMFTDSLIIFPGYLSALNGDYDGDMISVVGVFTKEANENAHKHIHSLGNLTGVDGTTIRSLGKLCQQAIRGLTY